MAAAKDTIDTSSILALDEKPLLFPEDWVEGAIHGFGKVGEVTSQKINLQVKPPTSLGMASNTCNSRKSACSL